MLRVGGSLTDIQNNPTTMSGGGLADAIMTGMNKINESPEEVVPKVEIPDNSITEEIVPDAKITEVIIEQARDIDESSFSLTAILNMIIAYIAKVLFIGFDIENKMIQNGLLALVWLCIAGLLFAVAIAIPNTNITFIIYCSAIWIIALAILFVILQPYQVVDAV